MKITSVGGRKSNTVEAIWNERNGIIFSSVLSDGTTGPNWIKRLEHRGFRLGENAKGILRSPYFSPTSNIRTQVAIIKGTLFEESERDSENVRALAEKHKFEVPEIELICLMRDKFLDKDLVAMGLFWLIGMHTPVKIDGGSWLLCADRIEDREGYGSFMVAYRGGPKCTWDRDTGFLFKVSSKKCGLSIEI